MARVIVIASGKGGVGKTTIAAGIGADLGAMNKKTVLIDLDMGLRNIDVLLGMETQVLNHWGDYISGRLPLEECLTSDERFPGLSLLAAAQNEEGLALSADDLKAMTDQLKESFDVILIDCPAGIGPLFRAACAHADEGIVVTNPVVSAVRDADKVLHLMEKMGVPRRFILINAIRFHLMKHSVMMSPDDISEVLGADLLGIVPEDEHVLIACNRGMPPCDTAYPAGKALSRISQRIAGIAAPMPPLNKKRGGLFRRK